LCHFLKHETIVSSKIDFYQNALSADKSGNLFLNGIDLELISILVDGVEPKYTLVEDGLQLREMSQRFTLEIQTKIHPETTFSQIAITQQHRILIKRRFNMCGEYT
jgi:aminopeptidase N